MNPEETKTTTTDPLPSSLVANIQSVLAARRGGGGAVHGDAKPVEEGDAAAAAAAATSSSSGAAEPDAAADGSEKPIVLVTNAEGIRSPGLTSLVDGLVRGELCRVSVCAPESDKSTSGHSVTVRETLAATSVEITGASAFEVSGTPADCVSLALSGALFSWTKPALVISGISRGSNCGHQMTYSGAVAGAREALLCGIPSIAISLNWKQDESQESDFTDAVNVCIPLIHAAIKDIEKGVFPKSCLLNIGIPSSPSTNKGFKLTRHSQWRCAPSWQAISANKRPSQLMAMHQSIGIQLAQLGRDASAAAAVRRSSAQRKTVEVESVAPAGKPESQEVVKKLFRLEFLEKGHEDLDEDLDFRALENGFISVTPIHLQLYVESEIQSSASDWLSSALTGGE
uniref:Survival protein SurE-like phosphatase/nucleotidase domain-containing protein n=1 Tax=Ananas comosus var. bracteatus TaxID=296719 RepID=A0A6V7QUB2_ANACO